MRKMTFLLEIKFKEKPRALLDLLNALTEKIDEICASEKAFDYQLSFYTGDWAEFEKNIIIDWAKPDTEEDETT